MWDLTFNRRACWQLVLDFALSSNINVSGSRHLSGMPTLHSGGVGFNRLALLSGEGERSCLEFGAVRSESKKAPLVW